MFLEFLRKKGSENTEQFVLSKPSRFCFELRSRTNPKHHCFFFELEDPFKNCFILERDGLGRISSEATGPYGFIGHWPSNRAGITLVQDDISRDSTTENKCSEDTGDMIISVARPLIQTMPPERV